MRNGYRTYFEHELAEMLSRLEAGKPPHTYFDSIEDAYKFYEAIYAFCEKIRGSAAWGSGVELGAGTGLAASILTHRDIDNVAITDFMEGTSEHIIGLTAQKFARAAKYSIEAQDFHSLTMQEASCDFVLCLASLHHASNLGQVFSEIRRVLRPGGWMFAQDRSHRDCLTEPEIEEMLDVKLREFSDERGNGVVITRRESGEHEIRIGEWIDHLNVPGFRSHIFWTGGFKTGGYARIFDKRFNIVFGLSLPLMIGLRLASAKFAAVRRIYVALHGMFRPRLNLFYYVARVHTALKRMTGPRPFRGRPVVGAVYVSEVPAEVFFGKGHERGATNALIAMQKVG